MSGKCQEWNRGRTNSWRSGVNKGLEEAAAKERHRSQQKKKKIKIKKRAKIWQQSVKKKLAARREKCQKHYDSRGGKKKKKKKRHRLFSSERNRFIVGIRVQVAVAPPLTLGHSYFLVLAAWPSHTLAGSSALGGCAKLQSVEVYASGTTQR